MNWAGHPFAYSAGKCRGEHAPWGHLGTGTVCVCVRVQGAGGEWSLLFCIPGHLLFQLLLAVTFKCVPLELRSSSPRAELKWKTQGRPAGR